MSNVILVTDRPELKNRLQHALRQGPVLRHITNNDWLRSEFGGTRDRVFLLDLPTPRSLRELLPVAENWPHGFAGRLLAILGEDAVSSYVPAECVDDLMMEPFTDIEAVLRVKCLLWKHRQSAPPEQMVFGGLAIDTESYEVSVCGTKLELTYKEYEVLRFLASNPGKVFTRDHLLSRVWGEDYYGGTRTVDVHIRRLRLKLGMQYDCVIGTVRNVGYRFVIPEG